MSNSNSSCSLPTASADAHVSNQAPTAVVVLSDPASGSEEALGRVFNALAVVHDARSRGEEVELLFQGAGTRWPGVLASEDHPAHELYESVKPSLAGVSCGCADVFGAGEEVDALGLVRLSDNAVPGTSGLPSLLDKVRAGWSVVTF